jgi:hypothetical protein
MSVVVDFDHRTVSGFWSELNGFHIPLPIKIVDANSVTFSGQKELAGTRMYIQGSVDRITAKIDAMETTLWLNGGSTRIVWDLRCKPTKPLF